MAFDSADPTWIRIYTDGGADPNPGPGGWGVVILHPGNPRTVELSGAEPRTTNNRMELTAAIRALEAMAERSQVHLFTDSLYLKKGVTEWLPGWIRRDFRRKDGELQNEDLWRRMAELIREHEIRWDWLRGHAGHRHNERADQLATAAMKAQRQGPAAAAVDLPPTAPPDAEVFLRVAGGASRGGWAALVRDQEQDRVLHGAAAATSNALDLLAAVAALEALPKGASVAVYTASDYLRNGALQWMAGWRRSGWKTKEGAEVKNRELWQRLAAAIDARKVAWPRVHGEALAELKALGTLARDAAGA